MGFMTLLRNLKVIWATYLYDLLINEVIDVEDTQREETGCLLKEQQRQIDQLRKELKFFKNERAADREELQETLEEQESLIMKEIDRRIKECKKNE